MRPLTERPPSDASSSAVFSSPSYSGMKAQSVLSFRFCTPRLFCASRREQSCASAFLPSRKAHSSLSSVSTRCCALACRLSARSFVCAMFNLALVSAEVSAFSGVSSLVRSSASKARSSFLACMNCLYSLVWCFSVASKVLHGYCAKCVDPEFPVFVTSLRITQRRASEGSSFGTELRFPPPG